MSNHNTDPSLHSDVLRPMVSALGCRARTRTLSLALGLALLGATASAQVSIGWIAQTRGVSIAVDTQDNVFTVDYEQQLGAEVVVTKRNVHGQLVWTASIDQTDPTKWERAQWIALDSQGDVIVCGTLMSGFSSPVVAASILAKFDASGAPLWRIVYDGPFDGTATTKCIIDASDDIYVLGTGIGTSLVTTKIKKFAPNGAALWTYLDAAGIGLPVNFKFAGDGDLVVAARAPFGSLNGYAKVDSATGSPLWSLPGISSLTVGDAAGDSLGNTYVVHGEFVMNGGTVVKKLDPQGAELWSRTFVSSGFRVEVGADEHPVVAGFPSSGAPGAAFFKVDPSGALAWANLDADGALMLLLHAQLVLDGVGNAYLAAGLLGSMAVCKVHSDGSSAWTVTTPGGSGAHALALGRASSSVFVVGGVTVRLLDPQPVGVPFCGPAVSNSTGLPGRISARGSDVAAWNDVTLVASALPLNASAYFLNARSGGFVPQPGGSQGNLCLSGPIGRYVGAGQVQNSGAQGRVELRLDLPSTPTPTGPTAALAGSTWSFQCWYRDQNPTSTSNFTEALSVTFR